jgi:hypothetical protein
VTSTKDDAAEDASALITGSVGSFASSPVFFNSSPNDFCPPEIAPNPPPVPDANPPNPLVEVVAKADWGILVGAAGILKAGAASLPPCATGEGDRLSGAARGESIAKIGFGVLGFTESGVAVAHTGFV